MKIPLHDQFDERGFMIGLGPFHVIGGPSFKTLLDQFDPEIVLAGLHQYLHMRGDELVKKYNDPMPGQDHWAVAGLIRRACE